MKKKLLFISCLFFGLLINAQQLYMEVGKTVSSFSYKNSNGDELENLLSKPNTYLNMGYKSILSKDKLYLSIGATYNGYGAIGSDNTLDNFFEWDVTYLGAEVGLDFMLFRLREFTFYAKGSMALEFLINGNQTLNNQVFNLVGEDEFNSHIFFVRGSIGMQYPISNNTSIMVNYKIGKTALAGQGKAGDKEKLNLIAHQFGIGLIINLPGCNCSF